MPTTDADVIAILTRPFDKKQVKQKGRFDYIGHAFITERLNEADPFWESVVAHVHEEVGKDGAKHCKSVTMQLTIHFPEHGPVTRTESGGPQRAESFTNEIKNAQSDALKRCAMRFGVALSMWEKLLDAAEDEDYQTKPQPKAVVNGKQPGAWIESSGSDRVRTVSDGIKPEQVKAINDLANRIGDPDWVSSLFGSKRANNLEELHYRDAVAVIKAMSDRLSKAPAVQRG